MRNQDRIEILFIVNSLVRRGAEQQLFSFIKTLVPQIGISIFRFSTADNEFPELFNFNSVRIFSNKQSGRYNFLKLKPLYDCLSKQKYDAVITLGLGAALFFGRLFALLTGTKILYSFLNTVDNFHNIPRLRSDYFDILNKSLNILTVMFRRKTIVRFISNSKKLSNIVRGSVGNYPIHTIYNGLPIAEIQHVSEHIPDSKTKALLNQFDGYRTIVQVGALDGNKNLKFTLRRLIEIKHKLPEIRFLIIGEGHEKSELVEFVSANNLENQVIFAGKMKRLDCLCLMRRTNLLVLTSESESFPNVIAEAQALSLPVITFDVGAVREIIHQGVTGYVVRIGDKEEFNQKLIELVTDDHLATKMGKMAQQRVIRLFSMEKKVKCFLSILFKDLELVKRGCKIYNF